MFSSVSRGHMRVATSTVTPAHGSWCLPQATSEKKLVIVLTLLAVVGKSQRNTRFGVLLLLGDVRINVKQIGVFVCGGPVNH